MIPLQADPNSPATQPYNQAPKPAYNSNIPGMGQQNPFGMPMQQQPMQQQPMQLPMQQHMQQQPVACNNPFAEINAFQNQQPVAEPHSPVPQYAAFQGNSPAPVLNQAQPFAAPVTPPSQYSAGRIAQNPAPEQQQQQNACNPFASIMAENQPQPVTPTLHYNMPQPVTPTLQYNMPSRSMAPTTPPAFTSESNFAVAPGANDETVSFDFGPPMGSPLEGGPKISELTSTSLVPTNKSNQYGGIVSGMRALTVRPGQTPPEEQAYGNYSPTYPTQQPVQQQPAAYPSPSDWNPMAQQQQQQAVPYQGYGQGNGTQIPGLGHSSPQGYHQSPYGGTTAAPPTQGYFSYDNAPANAQGSSSYDQGACQSYNRTAEISSPLDQKPRNSLDDHKSMTDLTRERTSNLRALRLLEKAANDYGYNDGNDDGHGYVGSESHKGMSVREKAKLERAKLQQAKQIRKMKKREFKTKNPAALTESSRAGKKSPRGYDPELTCDKCQLDFDRQRGAQKKALQLMSSF